MPANKDPQETFADLRFPVKGIDTSQAYGAQQPGTTPLGINVRAYDVFQQRSRGGSRPGLVRYINAQVQGATLIQDLNYIVYVS